MSFDEEKASNKYNSLGFIDPIEEESNERISSKWKLFFAIIFTSIVLVLLLASLSTIIVLDATLGIYHSKHSAGDYCKVGCEPHRYQHGAVATDNSQCSVVGADILKQNGNAIDAVIATTFCQGVTSPVSSGIGGGGVLLFYNATSKDAIEYDFREKAPLNATENMYKDDYMKAQRGIRAIAVPGELKGMYDAWKKHGSLPWANLVQPSIKMAREGHLISKHLSDSLQRHKNEFFKYTTEEESDIKKMFAPTGEWYKEGDLAKYPKLADTLEKISQDPNSFYFGEIRDKLIKDIQGAGGIIMKEDFEKYEPKILKPLTDYWQGHKIFTANPQYSGACAFMGLNILEGFNLPKEGFSFQSLHKMVEAMKFYFAYRVGLADPDYENIEEYMKLFLSKDHAAEVRTKINLKKTMKPDYYVPPHREPFYLPEDHGTTHVSVVDKHGNGAALTSTVNLEFGSYVVSKSTGIVLNDEMDDFSIPNKTNAFGVPPSPENFIKPEKRPVSSMNPMIVLTDNKLSAVLGASGGTRIISSTYQVFLNLFAFGMNVGQAVNSPRLHHQWYPNKLRIEAGYPFVNEFRSYGHEIEELSQDGSGGLLGVSQAIHVLPDGTVEASSDHRKGGAPDGH
eukprot:gene9133-1222_t